MASLEEQITKAGQEHAAKVARLRQEYAVREALAMRVPGLADYIEPSIHVSPLYGRVGSIAWETERYASLAPKNRRQPDRGLVDLLTVALPGHPMTMYRDGCLSFRATAYVDGLSDEAVSRAELTPVAPWTVKADPNPFSDSVAVNWFALVDGQVWELSVEFPRHACRDIGDWDIVLKRTKHGDISEVVRCDLRPTFRAAPEPPQRVRWGTGSPTGLHTFTLWWHADEPEVEEQIRRGIVAAMPEGARKAEAS